MTALAGAEHRDSAVTALTLPLLPEQRNVIP